MTTPLAARAALGAAALLGHAAGALAPLILRRRLAAGKEHPERYVEKLGRGSAGWPKGPLVQVHAASVGEFNAALPLIEAIALQAGVLVTTGTLTSAALAAERLPQGGALHRFAPIDAPAIIRRHFAEARPDALVLVESELWPNLMAGARRAGVPVLLANARMSDRSFRRWSRLRPLAEGMLGLVDHVLAQSDVDADRYRALGARVVECAGNLKFDGPPPPADPATLAALDAAIGRRPRIFAASAHPGEADVILDAFLGIRRARPDALLILAPRHPERADAFAAAAGARGLATARRGRGEAPGGAAVYIADTIGEMGLWYRLATVAVIGGSYIPHGGQSPLEAAKLGRPSLRGPSTGNFEAVFAALDAVGASLAAPDAATLETHLSRLLDDPAEGEQRGAAGQAVAERHAGALARTIAALVALRQGRRG